MIQVTIRSGEIPDLHVKLTTAEIRALEDCVLELQPRDIIGIEADGTVRQVRVFDVDWELAGKLGVIASDGAAFIAHVQDWDEDHGVVVIELD